VDFRFDEVYCVADFSHDGNGFEMGLEIAVIQAIPQRLILEKSFIHSSL
jgi:hypothetical protein